MENGGHDGISFDVRYDILDELIQRQKLHIAHRVHLSMQRLQQLLGLAGIVCGDLDDIFYTDMEQAADADHPLQGEVPLAPLQLSVILGIQIEMLGQLLLGHFVQQTVFFDVPSYGIRFVFVHVSYSL